MKITTEKIAHWKTLYKHGDYQVLAGKYQQDVNQHISLKFARDLVQEAFKFGVCRDNLYPVIEKYYQGVEKELSKQK
jgi:hypothetical protein